MELIFRRGLILALLALVGFGSYRMLFTEREINLFEAKGEEILAERVDQWISLRLQNNWVQMYNELVDPAQQPLLSMRDYLNLFGKNVLVVLEMRPEEQLIDAAKRQALTVLYQKAKLDVSLPMFEHLDEPHEEHLISEGPLSMEWVWRGDNWYWKISRDFIRGEDQSGRKLSPVEDALNSSGHADH